VEFFIAKKKITGLLLAAKQLSICRAIYTYNFIL